MRVKSFFRLVLAIIVAFTVIGGAVAGGVWVASLVLANPGGLGQNSQEQNNIGKNWNSEGSSKSTQEKQKVLNALLLGVDSEGYRTDVIILAQYNFDTKKVNMLQIPRDTKVQTSRPDKKINAAYAFGREEELFKRVRNLLGIDVDKYVLVNLDGFRRLVDEIGGVEVYVPFDMDYDDPVQSLHIHLKKGKQVLDGEKAEMFVRFRKNNDGTGYPDGDVGRVKAQQQFISAAITKVLSLKNIFKIPKLVAIVSSNVKTNFESYEMVKYAGEALQFDRSNINMMTLPGEGDYIGGISYYIHDPVATQQVMKEYFTPKLKNAGMETEELGNNNKQNQQAKNGDERENSQQVQKDDEYQPSWRNRFMRVEVLNGSNANGVATKVAEQLKAKGFRVISIGNFQGVRYNKTEAIDRTNKGYAGEVSKALGGTVTGKDLDNDCGVDVTVIVGNDYQQILRD